MLLIVASSYLPNPALHPGATSPDVTQHNIQSTICKSGYTKTIRPPVSYTDSLKLRQIKDEGLSGKPGDYEEDHLISLELGGAPKDPKNLWPEPWRKSSLVPQGYSAEDKDAVESRTHKLVCLGQMSLADAQTQIAGDWHALYVKENQPIVRGRQNDEA